MCQYYSWGVARKICSIGERGMVAPLNHDGIKELGGGGRVGGVEWSVSTYEMGLLCQL